VGEMKEAEGAFNLIVSFLLLKVDFLVHQIKKSSDWRITAVWSAKNLWRNSKMSTENFLRRLQI